MGDSLPWSRNPNRRHGKAAPTPICFLMVHFSFLKRLCLPTHVSHLPKHLYEEVLCILVCASFSAPSLQMVHKPRVLSDRWKHVSHESPPKCMNFLFKKYQSSLTKLPFAILILMFPITTQDGERGLPDRTLETLVC